LKSAKISSTLSGQPICRDRMATRGARNSVVPPKCTRMILTSGYLRFLPDTTRWAAALKVSFGTCDKFRLICEYWDVRIYLCDRNAEEWMWVGCRRDDLGSVKKNHYFSNVELLPDGVVAVVADVNCQ
jgi:hypothetical protein